MLPSEDVGLVSALVIHVFVGFNDDPKVGSVFVWRLSKEESFVDDDFLGISPPVACNPVSFLFLIVRIIIPPLIVLGLLWLRTVPKMKHIA